MWLAGVLTPLIPAFAAAADLDQLAAENAALRERVAKLEADLAQIKSMLANQLAPGVPAGKKPVVAGVDTELYGFIKLDAAYDNSRGDSGNFMQWVAPESANRNDDQFSLTANQTRLGLRLNGPASEDWVTGGLIEVDFYGGGAQNKSNPMLRHGYLTAMWPKWGLSVLAGQSSDVISPLFMPTINYSVGWWQGNIGYRRPQLRLTETLKLAKQVDLKLEVAAARTMGRTAKFARTGGDTGEDAGFPTVQGRMSVRFPFLTSKPATLGISGHYGEEEWDIDANGRDRAYRTWSGNVDVVLPLTKWLTVQGEAFVGENLDAYLGGIAQGFNTNRMAVVGARGGWVAATWTPTSQWQVNLGAGYDDPKQGDLTPGVAGLNRSLNRVMFGNVWYFFTPNFSLGVEIAHQRTEYEGDSAGTNLREQLSLMYKF